MLWILRIQRDNCFAKNYAKASWTKKEIAIEVTATKFGVEIMAPPGMEEMTGQLQSMFSSFGKDKTKTVKLPIKQAYKQLCDEEAGKLINEEELKSNAITAAEQNGIVFIDEIDKVAKRSEATGSDVSREGVQRDLLPLIEGCTVTTKHGLIKTDHILFITSGAFHVAKPSDLIPELQGRLPIRVELEALSPDDFQRILTEPNASLTRQQTALMETEGLQLNFSDDGVRRIAEIAWEVNERTENIGARRLHTVMERLVEEISFNNDLDGSTAITLDSDYVNQHLGELAKDEDLSRFIL